MQTKFNAPNAAPNGRLMAWRLAMGVSLLAWFVKYKIQITLFFQGPENVIRHHSLIPDWLCSPMVSGVAYFTPALAFLALRTQRVAWLQVAAWAYALCALIMLWHVQSYSDATHVTALYTALWLAWWAGRVHGTDAASYWHGIALAIGVISLCWLGGGIGKLTSEYWAGDPFYQLYFIDKPQFPFSWLREHSDATSLHTYARWFSRSVIITELALATSILWPPRWAITGSILALSGMVIISQLQLFSVLGSLMGLAFAVGWLLKSEPKPSPHST
jgi:hypothetical protein